MSMKKLSKKMLAVVAAGAMTMGLAMPAFAAGAGEETTKVTKAYISKTYNTEVGKAMEFKFTATQNTTDADVVKSEVACTIPSISFTEGETGTTKKVSSEITFAPFKEAGKYEYTVTESATTDPVVTASKYEKLIMSQAEYKMDVYVVENPVGTFKVDNIVVNKTKDDNNKPTEGKVDISGDKDKNTFNFVNTYVQEAGTGTDPTNPDPTYKDNGALKVSKTIDAQGEKPSTTDSFSFTATFVFPEGTDATTLGGVKGNGEDVSLTKGAYTFTLKHGDNMKFTGLPVGTKITVTEAGAANYKASASVVLNGGTATTLTAAKYHADLTAVNGEKLGQKKNTVDVTNTYDHVPTTGIIMNTLPYVLMIALCGAALFGFVAFKRRR